MIIKFTTLIILVAMSIPGKYADNPCAQVKIKSQSIICVCNANYCDTITREEPIDNTYYVYTSSEAGSRFKKSNGSLQVLNDTSESSVITLEIDVQTIYQTVEGFGGAVTDAAGINWKNLSVSLQKHLIDSYFSDKGLEYNMIRLPIGGTDFSTHPYAYNELPEDDIELSNYTLSFEDYNYKIPLIKSAIAASKTSLHLVGTTWSPSTWMKTNHNYSGHNFLLKKYRQTYALYHLKFLEEYAKENITIWAITTTNEPINGALGLASFNCLGWTVKDMGEWIVNNLGPTIRNSSFKDVKILAADDQRLTLLYWINTMISKIPKTIEYIDGVAVHYYTDFITPANILSEIPRSYPKLFVISTEACEGSLPWETNKVELGSWQRAVNYANDIMTDLNHDVVGWIDWNICLNAQGGPNWARNYVDSPIIVYPENGEFVKQPMFYALGQFSKFIPRGSRRIQVIEKKSFFTAGVENVAFLTNKTVVTVLLNNGHAKTVRIKLGNNEATLSLEAKSITTVEFPYKS